MNPLGTLIIGQRFRGPNTSGNGGVSSGLLASYIQGAAEVTLRAPPPLDTEMLVTQGENRVELWHGDRMVATARPASLPFQAPAPVSFEAARAAQRGYRNRDHHPLPECFVCGTAREPGEALCIHPGPVPGTNVVAAGWVPDATVADGDSVRPEVVWGALDCPSFMGLGPDAPFAPLGRLTVARARAPRVGERCVVMGWTADPADGRKYFGGSAIYGEDQALLGVGRGVWIQVDPSVLSP